MHTGLGEIVSTVCTIDSNRMCACVGVCVHVTVWGVPVCVCSLVT